MSLQTISAGEFSLVPIRYLDRYSIMQWRNEQIYHLRQSEPLTKEKQDWYFANVVERLFDQENPEQILFSFLKGDTCVGYGGLVHMNWLDKNAELSFIMETSLEKEHFNTIWSVYLTLIERVAFEDLKMHKLYVYAFDLRPHLYETLEKNNYFQDARLKDHCFFEGKAKDVVIHSKINPLI
ncbi:GNAT family N-acetyltransferase [Roseivirga sp.]|uniref:GNAT family N-acetyltransferase n=1 Tax=Roseivirga sp. TaxID=1964215 RepID=UPI0023576F0E|nr:GNAT family N-acetyltransferase [Roseivirga sp.]